MTTNIISLNRLSQHCGAEPLRLSQLEDTIEKGLQTFYEVGAALAEIRDSNLYKANYSSFEAYLKERWDMGRQRAYQLIEAAEVIDGLKSVYHGGQLPLNERQVRELARIEPTKRAEVWGEATSDNTQPTAKKIKEVAEKNLPAVDRVLSLSLREKVRAANPDLTGFITPQNSEGVGDLIRDILSHIEAIELLPAAPSNIKWAQLSKEYKKLSYTPQYTPELADELIREFWGLTDLLKKARGDKEEEDGESNQKQDSSDIERLENLVEELRQRIQELENENKSLKAEMASLTQASPAASLDNIIKSETKPESCPHCQSSTPPRRVNKVAKTGRINYKCLDCDLPYTADAQGKDIKTSKCRA
jgi:transposase-like protein